ncbi:hypothetical protein RHSIM_Rhsim02G0137800 [Rhododendron simsii]|uniref:Uncharacterized protein n=1 Tax=Rhododendron simsii TaxID=118357 RepID=A0A834HEH1_RHOSS|nr:hypothetical protein RHSIM_Rhsim02G0137800 [Rhododendron simsii]
MADNQNPKNSPPPSSSDSRVPNETNHNGTATTSAAAPQKHHCPNPPEIGYNGSSSNGHKHHHYPNPPDPINPDAATLREQWRYAMRQYSRWYSQAWGSAILAGMAFFALGWIVKGSNPLPSFGNNNNDGEKRAQEQKPQQQEVEGHDVTCPPVAATLTSNPCDTVDTPKS